MPDTSLFDDSLGDDFHHKAKLSESVKPAQNLDDSLCDEETQLPSVEPEPADIGKLGTVIAEYKGSGRNLDDSLCCDMDEETLDNANEGGPLSGQISQTAQDVPVPCLDDNIDMGSSSPSLSIPEAISRDSTGKPMSPHESKSEENSQDSQPAATSKMVPSFGKKKKGFVPPAAKAPGPGNSTVTKPTCKNALKTKKSKCKTAKLEETTAGDCQEQKLCFDADKENGSGTPKPKSSPSKADTSVTANSKKKSAAAAPVANSTAGKGAMQQVAHEKKNRDSKKQEKEKMKLEREQKRQERETKKLEQEQKRAEKERLKEEKRLEQERKKVEREQKKLDKELKKLEQEQKKAQKQTTSGCGSLVQKKKSSNSEPPVQHNMSSEEGTGKSPENTVCDTTKEGSANSDFRVTSITKLSTSPPETTSPDAHSNPPGCNSAAPEGTATSGSEASSLEGAESNRDRKRMQVGETTLSSSSDEASTEHTISSAVSNCKQPDVSLVTSNSGQTGASKKPSSHPLTKVHVTSKDGKKVPKKAAVKKANLQLKESVDKKDQVKMKQASSSAMQHEKCHSDSPGQGSKNKSHIENKLTSIPRISAGSRKRKAVGADSITSCSESECEPPRPKKPRSKPSNYYGPVWVQCDRADCQKWRQLKDCRDPSEVPEKWICSMNTGIYCGSSLSDIVWVYTHSHTHTSIYIHTIYISCSLLLQSLPTTHVQLQRSSGQNLERARSLWSHHSSRDPLCGPRWRGTLGGYLCCVLRLQYVRSA